MSHKSYYVYIATNKANFVLYTGVTSNLIKRIHDHKNGTGSKFTTKYRINKLIYYEIYNDPLSAISREKQIKGGSRIKKIKLIESINPTYKDLSFDLV